MYHDLLHVILDDYRSGGISHRILKDASDRPVHDATPLRLLGALHRIVLDGRDQQLARHYESVGGQATSSLKEDALSALEACESEIREALTQQVQTNEPGRSLCHLALSHWFAHLGIKDFDLLEVGASAGLTMSFDRYCLRLPEGVVGDPSSSLEFPPSWIETSFPFHESPALCRTRRGVDISPIDVTTDSGVNRLLSFVWPDQHDRFRRLRLAIELTRQQPHHIDKASVESLFEFGRRATATTPLIWARMEPAGRVADIQVTIWDGASVSDWNLGTIGYHGQSLQWSPTRRTQ